MIFRSRFPDVTIPEQSFPTCVLGNAASYGTHIAFVDASTGVSMTFGELASEVRAIANGLSHRGYVKGDVLAIHSPSSIEFVIALFAAMSLGGIVTPVSTMATPDDLVKQLSDSGARYLLTTPELLTHSHAALERAALPEIFVTGHWPGATPFSTLRSNAPDAPEVAIDPDDVGLLLYSSGTTGLPKGVMLTHRSLVANNAQSCHIAIDGSEEVYFSLPPFSHSYGIWFLAFALQRGATMVILPQFTLSQFLGAVERYRITDACVVPPIVAALANAPGADAYDLSSLRRLCSGGAPLDGEIARRCQDRFEFVVTQGYGMTEASPLTHFMPMPGKPEKLGSIGVTVPNTECRIVDVVTGADLEPNERGELWIRGPQVMKGYFHQLDATAAAIDGEGWLRTGDIAYVDEEGDFYIVDRLKELIKVKGFQVAPAELEAVLLTHPAVSDVAVVRFPDAVSGEIPKAFVVARTPVEPDELIDWVAARVAPFKKVRLIEFIDQIPRSAAGKILRRVLIDRDAAVKVPAG